MSSGQIIGMLVMLLAMAGLGWWMVREWRKK
jgi:hypothetical protein